MAETLDLELYRGDTFIQELTLSDRDGNPLDVTGYTFASEIRRSEKSEVVIETFAVSVVDAESGEVTIRLESAETTDFPIPTTTWWWDFQSLSDDATPVVTTHYKGEVTVEREITRD